MKSTMLSMAVRAAQFKKPLQIGLIAMGVAGSGIAMASDVKVYGRAHVSLDMLDDGADYSEMNMSSNSSRLGFRAEKKAENGVAAFMQIEGEVTYNQGNSALSSRDTFVGLKGDFGQVRLGQFDSPFKAARGPANLFGDQVGDMRNLTRVGNGRFDERNPNTVHYRSPALGKAHVNVGYSVHEGTAAADGAKQTAVDLSVTYKDGPINLAVAYEQYAEDYSRGERTALRAAVGFSITDELKLVGFFQTVDHDNDAHDADTLGVGAEYKLSSTGTVRGMYMLRSGDGDDTDSSMIAVGYEHRFDRAIRVYVNYGMVANDDNVALRPWAEGRSTGVAAAAGETATALSFGLRYDF